MAERYMGATASAMAIDALMGGRQARSITKLPACSVISGWMVTREPRVRSLEAGWIRIDPPPRERRLAPGVAAVSLYSGGPSMSLDS